MQRHVRRGSDRTACTDRPKIKETINVAETKRVFDALSERGQVQMPLAETFYSPAFGMCIDRFGTPWMIMAEMPTAS